MDNEIQGEKDSNYFSLPGSMNYGPSMKNGPRSRVEKFSKGVLQNDGGNR